MTEAENLARLSAAATQGEGRIWTRWEEQRPPNERGSYRYRVRAEILGMILQPEWTEKMHLCGMGYRDSEWWPLRSCHWNGYQRYITHKGLEWSELREDDPKAIVWGGLDLLPCPFTGAQPTVEAIGQFIGAPLWRSEALRISSPAVPSRRFTSAKAMVEAWNTRSGRLVPLASVEELVLLIGDNAEGYAEGRNRWIIVSPDDLATAIHNHLKGTGDA